MNDVMEPCLATSLGNTRLNTCIFNASGAYGSTIEELLELAGSKWTGAVVSKTTKGEVSQGNLKPNLYLDTFKFSSINCIGLKNNGLEYYQSVVDKINKPYFISIYNPVQFPFDKLCCDVQLEWNSSCSNLTSDKLFEEEIRKLFEKYDGYVGIKMQNFVDKTSIFSHSDIIKEYPKVSHLVCSNTIRGLMIDTLSEKPIIRPNEGVGGMGGSCIKPFSLMNVYTFTRALPKLDIVGCGGIMTGEDAFQYILAGASAVQVGTGVLFKGVDIFRTISLQLQNLMINKAYKNIQEFKGRIKKY